MESRGLKAWYIDCDDDEEEAAMLVVRPIRVEDKNFHLVCLNVDFVRVAS